MTSTPQQALSCALELDSMAEKQCTWPSALPFPDALPVLQRNGIFSVFMEVATRKRHKKFAPSFTLTPSITLFNVTYINPHMRHSFRIWFQEKKKLVSPEKLIAKYLSFWYRNLLWFIWLHFIFMVLKYNCSLLTFWTHVLYVSDYFWEGVEVNKQIHNPLWFAFFSHSEKTLLGMF